ncbi:MAG TPA: hypothetical protein ENJ95_14355 [Bacteroidetes bacterium]|nr:hypothetical protein [Bacteroidota bacterium]
MVKWLHVAIQPFNHSTIQPFNHSTIQPFNHSTIQPFNHFNHFNHLNPHPSYICARKKITSLTKYKWAGGIGLINHLAIQPFQPFIPP